jgi:hypothetical protein
MRHIVACWLAVAVALPVIGACGGDDEEASCTKVTSAAVLEGIGVGDLWAVKGDHFGNPNKDDAWYVSSSSSATWTTSIRPDAEESGLILPVNAQARAESEAGVDADPTAPIYGTVSASSDGAHAAQTCAADGG